MLQWRSCWPPVVFVQKSNRNPKIPSEIKEQVCLFVCLFVSQFLFSLFAFLFTFQVHDSPRSSEETQFVYRHPTAFFRFGSRFDQRHQAVSGLTRNGGAGGNGGWKPPKASFGKSIIKSFSQPI